MKTTICSFVKLVLFYSHSTIRHSFVMIIPIPCYVDRCLRKLAQRFVMHGVSFSVVHRSRVYLQLLVELLPRFGYREEELSRFHGVDESCNAGEA